MADLDSNPRREPPHSGPRHLPPPPPRRAITGYGVGETSVQSDANGVWFVPAGGVVANGVAITILNHDGSTSPGVYHGRAVKS